jgi:hypothetical protein
MPADTPQKIYVDYADVLIEIWDILSSKIDVLIEIWDILSSKIQVYGIFCPLKYKYMGYSA